MSVFKLLIDRRFLPASMILVFAWLGPAPFLRAQEPPSFTIQRFLACGAVQGREPVGINDVFPVETKEVYAFLEARDIQNDTVVSTVWYHQEKMISRIALLLKKGPRWRTYASKKIADRKGNWLVELQDEGYNVIQAVIFNIE